MDCSITGILYIVPEYCQVWPVRLLRGAFRVPSVIWLLGCRMLALKVMSRIQVSLKPSLEMCCQCLTSPGSHLPFDYERLEFLGDAYLKYCISSIFYFRFPSKQEGELSMWRESIVKNSSLAKAAYKFDQQLNEDLLAGCLNLAPSFNGNKSLLIHPTFLESREMRKLPVKEKRLADCVEAMTGAYVTLNDDGAISEWLKFVGVLQPDMQWPYQLPQLTSSTPISAPASFTSHPNTPPKLQISPPSSSSSSSPSSSS